MLAASAMTIVIGAAPPGITNRMRLQVRAQAMSRRRAGTPWKRRSRSARSAPQRPLTQQAGDGAGRGAQQLPPLQTTATDAQPPRPNAVAAASIALSEPYLRGSESDSDSDNNNGLGGGGSPPALPFPLVVAGQAASAGLSTWLLITAATAPEQLASLRPPSLAAAFGGGAAVEISRLWAAQPPAAAPPTRATPPNAAARALQSASRQAASISPPVTESAAPIARILRPGSIPDLPAGPTGAVQPAALAEVDTLLFMAAAESAPGPLAHGASARGAEGAARFDLDGDGTVRPSEVAAAVALDRSVDAVTGAVSPDAFEAADADGDGAVGAGEWARAFGELSSARASAARCAFARFATAGGGSGGGSAAAAALDRDSFEAALREARETVLRAGGKGGGVSCGRR